MTTEEIAAFAIDAAARAGMHVSDWLRMTQVDATHRSAPLASPIQLANARRLLVTFEVWKRHALSVEAPEHLDTITAAVIDRPQLGDVVTLGGIEYSVTSRRHRLDGDMPSMVVGVETIHFVPDGY